MKSLITRTFSAVIAILIIFLLYKYFGDFGLKVLVFFGASLANFEISKILFFQTSQKIVKLSFFVTSLLVFVLSTQFYDFTWVIFSCAFVLFSAFIVFIERKIPELIEARDSIGLCALGMAYGAFLPLAIYQILISNAGTDWFILLLLVIFSGDTFAYISGMLWGDSKISPRISPKKTLVGSIGGIIGSVLATVVYAYFYFPNLSLGTLVGIASTASFAGQTGDLFESLLKRVANIKDSGSIMPGHGGILDRIDGVLFAAPILLLWIKALS